MKECFDSSIWCRGCFAEMVHRLDQNVLMEALSQSETNLNDTVFERIAIKSQTVPMRCNYNSILAWHVIRYNHVPGYNKNRCNIWLGQSFSPFTFIYIEPDHNTVISRHATNKAILASILSSKQNCLTSLYVVWHTFSYFSGLCLVQVWKGVRTTTGPVDCDHHAFQQIHSYNYGGEQQHSCHCKLHTHYLRQLLAPLPPNTHAHAHTHIYIHTHTYTKPLP